MQTLQLCSKFCPLSKPPERFCMILPVVGVIVSAITLSNDGCISEINFLFSLNVLLQYVVQPSLIFIKITKLSGLHLHKMNKKEK